MTRTQFGKALVAAAMLFPILAIVAGTLVSRTFIAHVQWKRLTWVIVADAAVLLIGLAVGRGDILD